MVELPKSKVPSFTFNAPEIELSPVSLISPEPDLLKEPAPTIFSDNVYSLPVELLTSSVAPLETEVFPAVVPNPRLLPICKVPADIVDAPV